MKIMNAAIRNTPKQGFSPLIIIIILAIVGISAFAFFSKKTQQSVPQSTKVVSNDFKSFDSEGYILYLPQNLEETKHTTKEESTLIHYGDTDTAYKDDVGIDFFILPVSKLKGTCEDENEAIRKNIQSIPGGKVEKAEKIDLQNATVCDSMWTTPVDGKNLSDTVTIHQKKFVSKNNDRDSYYILVAKYFKSYPEEFKENLESVLSKFIIK